LHSYRAHLAPHSFPTRRSSDLPQRWGEIAASRDGEVHRRMSPRQGPDRVDEIAVSLHRVEIPDGDDQRCAIRQPQLPPYIRRRRSEEHTSELQSLAYLVCRLLL